MGVMTSCDNRVCQTMSKLHAAAERRKVSRNIDLHARPRFLRIRRKPRKIVCKCTCGGSCRLYGKSKFKGCSESYTRIDIKKKSCSVQVEIDIPNYNEVGCGDDEIQQLCTTQTRKCCRQKTISCHKKSLSCHNEKTFPCHSGKTLSCQVEKTLPCQSGKTIICQNEKKNSCQSEKTIPCQIEKTIPCQVEKVTPCRIENTIPCQTEKTLSCQTEKTTSCQSQKTSSCQTEKITTCQTEKIKITADFGCSPICTPQPPQESRTANTQVCKTIKTQAVKCECKKPKKIRSTKSVSSCCNDAAIQTSQTSYCSKIVETEFDLGPACHCKKVAVSCVGDQNFDCYETDSVSCLDDDYQIPTKTCCQQKKIQCKTVDYSRNHKGRKVFFRDTIIQTSAPENCSKYVDTSDNLCPRMNKNDLLNGKFSIDAYFVR